MWMNKSLATGRLMSTWRQHREPRQWRWRRHRRGIVGESRVSSTTLYRTAERVVAHADSRPAIDPSAPPSFLSLLLTSLVNVATEQPSPAHNCIITRVRFYFPCNNSIRVLSLLSSLPLSCWTVIRSNVLGDERAAATLWHVKANIAGRFSYCVSFPREFRAILLVSKRGCVTTRFRYFREERDVIYSRL